MGCNTTGPLSNRGAIMSLVNNVGPYHVIGLNNVIHFCIIDLHIDKMESMWCYVYFSHYITITRTHTPVSIWLVSWSLTSPFSTNMAISETKVQGWRAIPTQ